MRYDTETSELFTDDFQLIKKLCCPLKKDWESLQWLGGNDTKRLCLDCRHPVINTAIMKENEVVAIMRFEPSTCLRIEAKPNGNVSLMGAQIDGHRVIHTAWTEEAMNAAIERGFRPLVKKVLHTDKIKQKLGFHQNEETGKVSFVGDYRAGLIPSNTAWYNPHRGLPPFAAYLIPDEIEIGERVFIEDLIEEFVGTSWNQGDTYRLRSAFARWDGTEFKIDYDEQTMRGEFVG